MYNPFDIDLAQSGDSRMLSPDVLALLKLAATIDPYGLDPRYPAPQGWQSFDPKYIALLYIRLEPNWRMVVNHACYEMPAGHSDRDRLDKARDIFQDKLRRYNAGNDVMLGDPQLQHHGPYKHQVPALSYHPDPGRLFDSLSLADFKFAGQNEIFICIHRPKTAIKLIEEDLIAFSLKLRDNSITMPNYAFFNARSEALGDPTLEADLIGLRNYATNNSGHLLPPNTTLEYAMDIKFQVDAGPAGWVTMVIDPDTGNGTGYEP